VPATYVVTREGRIALAAIDVDYRNRLEPDAILTTLRSLAPM
jgi:peroxiredoxin